MTVTLEGEQKGSSAPRRRLGPTLQLAGRSEAADERTLMGVHYEPLVLAHSLTREILMEQIHRKFS
jgi:hypothetical protein